MRTKLIEELAIGWREAENHYLNSDLTDDSLKSEMWDKTEEANLTQEELDELNAICVGIGV